MPRPLTAADRVPETGDCLLKPGEEHWRQVTAKMPGDSSEVLVDHWNGKSRTWFMLEKIKTWQYSQRRDGGPITTED